MSGLHAKRERKPVDLRLEQEFLETRKPNNIMILNQKNSETPFVTEKGRPRH